MTVLLQHPLAEVIDAMDRRSLDITNRVHWLGTESCTLERRLVATSDIDRYKEWIGIPDREIRSGEKQPTPQRPRWLRPPARFRTEGELSSEDHLELNRAVAAYVWGDSAMMRQWRGAIRRHASSFTLDVIVADTIHLQRGGRLVIAERPTLLVVRHLILDGGTLTMTVDGHVVVDHLEQRRVEEVANV